MQKDKSFIAFSYNIRNKSRLNDNIHLYYIYKRENAKETHRSAFSLSLFIKNSSICNT